MSTMMKYHRAIPFSVVLGLFALILAACANQSAPSSVPTAPLPQANYDSTIINSSNAVPATVPVATVVSENKGAANVDVSFAKDIMPILQTSCISCHGGEKTSKGLDLKTFASLMAGSQFGPVIVPGDAAKSKMVQSVQSGKMPKRSAKLTVDQIHLFMDWVNAGAKDN